MKNRKEPNHFDESQMSQEEVDGLVNNALRKLVRKDLMLLRLDVNERSITHWIAFYLQQEFPDWNVDCEYNRHLDETKRLKLDPEDVKTNDTMGRTVYPDVIVHKRNTDENLLVVEVKKSTSTIDDSKDIIKLDAFKQQLRYQHALFLKILTDSDSTSFEKQWR
ncbi:MAG: hypothetical protein ACKVRP_02840 [Bacteroidota bacterium]